MSGLIPIRVIIRPLATPTTIPTRTASSERLRALAPVVAMPDDVDHAAEGARCRHRQIEPAGDQDHRLAEGDHAEHGVIRQDLMRSCPAKKFSASKVKNTISRMKNPPTPEQLRTLSDRRLADASEILGPDIRIASFVRLLPVASASARCLLIEAPRSVRRRSAFRAITRSVTDQYSLLDVRGHPRPAAPSASSSQVSVDLQHASPTSTPRVGSFRTSRAGLDTSRLPSSTFCWLPPLSEETSLRQPSGQRIWRISRHRPPSSLGRGCTKPSRRPDAFPAC